MMAHVAEAGERKGRVLLRLTSCHPSPHALEAAIRVAQAFQSEIESLFIEDSQLLSVASFPFASEVSFSGRRKRALSPESLERDLRFACQSLHRQMDGLARAAEVPHRSKVVRDEPLAAIAAACAENGPWNVVALGEPFAAGAADELRRIFEQVADTTGLVIVGPSARRTAGGPIIAVIEDSVHLPAMMRAAERLRPSEETTIIAMLVAEDAVHMHWLEGEARLALGDITGQNLRVMAVELPHEAARVLPETLRRLQGGFAIGQWGGLLVPSSGDLTALATALECPLLLVR